ncbi:MAG: cobalamin B12-binding domain-containing protein [Deltaproteobacteria bacterium]|nr:cobalamin B12-binding domain-containing protein [Deltaproteobacteria bacterium]
MSRLDLVLVNPGSRRQVYQSLAPTLAAIEPPVWAGLMATFIHKRGFSVQVIDAEAEDWTVEEAAQRVVEMAPSLVAIVVYGHQPSASTQIMPAASALCRELKELAPDLKTVLVGGHVAALPERTLREEQADFVCGGEGPYTLLELLQAVKSGRSEDYRNVRGLWYREDGELRANPPAPLVKNLDAEMTAVAWELLPMARYRAHNWHCFGVPERQPYAAFYTTLGCPYHCSFCCIQAPFKSGEKESGYKENVNTYRLWSPDVVLQQIDRLVRDYGVQNIKIADEMFVLNPRHVAAICDRIIERRYKLNIWAYARVDTVKGDIVDKLKAAGFNWLAFGIESASARVRDDVQKGFGQEEIFETIEKVRSAGINVIANFIFGLPEDDLESMEETLQMALDLNCEFANFYCTMAYPGSPLYDLARQKRWRLPEKWSGYSQHSVDALPLPTKYCSAGEVLRFRDRSFQVYLSSPKYLEMIARKFGGETAQHVQEMASYRLERLHA